MEEYTRPDWRGRLHEVIYESNTKAGKTFDIALLIAIIASILVVMMDSVPELNRQHGRLFLILEWAFTGLFTLEYILRLVSIRRPQAFVLSPLGLIDLLAIIPSYLSFFLAGAQALLVLRVLRLLRIFRIFKLTRFLTEMDFLSGAIRASVRKIAIFMLAVISLITILGSVMYLVEGRQNGFTSIPDSIYWAVVTVTTVGYGDIAPVTPLGKFIASIMMLIGYGIIAVPTGIITSEFTMKSMRDAHGVEVCPGCGREGHDANAKHCKWCGAKL
jgi:voltage-gated potassium channel